MTLDDWIAAGYKRYEVKDSELNKLADFLLQKRFDDDEGKKDFITVYCYDRTKYPAPHRNTFKEGPIGYMPSAQFILGEGAPFFNIEMNGVESMSCSVQKVEDWFEVFWKVFRQPYYEKWERDEA